MLNEALDVVNQQVLPLGKFQSEFIIVPACISFFSFKLVEFLLTSIELFYFLCYSLCMQIN